MTVRAPPNGHVFSQANGFAPSDRQNLIYSDNSSRAGSQYGAGSTNGDAAPKARYPHIKDLQAKADAAQDSVVTHTPIRSLLNHAQKSANQAITDVSFRRPDRAYVEYLISSDILLNVIPRHKDYPTLKTDRGGWQRIYRQLCKENDAQHGMFKQIYDMIVEDNMQSGTRPSSPASAPNHSQGMTDRSRYLEKDTLRPHSMLVGPGFTEENNELFVDPTHAIASSQSGIRPLSGEQIYPQQVSTLRKERPAIHPKPESLQGGARVINGTSKDLLAERFSQLRVQRDHTPIRTALETHDVSKGSFVEMPSPTDYTPPSENSPSSTYQTRRESWHSSSPGKPSGPRNMPLPPPNPPHPPKIPLYGRPEVSLPRAPSPAYNPSRAFHTSSSTPPPLTRKGSTAGKGMRSSYTTGGSGNVEGAGGIQQTSPRIDGDRGTRLTKTISADLPHATTITANELAKHLRAYRTLLIDVRSRKEYDQGHVFAKSIMCIEPLGLRSGMSAEELEDRLVVSPSTEQVLFEQRNEFDLVVYYDQKTRSTQFLMGPPTGHDASALRALHDTIYEFNYYKPLRRPPVMLSGGLDAWIDIVGQHGLATSSTAALVGSTGPRAITRKSGRPLGRVPMASSNSNLEVRKRRLREHKPLDADEEKTWLERARNEEVETEEYRHAQSDGDTDSNQSDTDEPISPFIHTYEDFLRKFPESSSIQQSMMIPMPPPPPRLAPSMPAVPSRPPPAVPRPSYSGVSERDSSQLSPTSRQPSSAQPPLYTSRSISHYLKLPRTGLINFSVTCYMNATIQCLLATVPLSQFFLDNRWRDFTQKNWKGSNGIMPEIYANLIRSLWKGDVQAVRPTSFRNFCARLNSEWGVDRQQDAKEFFDFLLDCLHEDLNLNWERNPLRPLSTSEELLRERTPMRKVSEIEWNRYSHREKSYISQLFAGQHASRLRCTTCQNTSTTYEAFYSISVEIPHSGRGDINECLRSYCQEEMLSGDEVWKCSYCKCEREATKQITITRAPQVLVIHFKRFSASKTESARKVHTPIHFPLHGLNIEPYMAPGPPQLPPTIPLKHPPMGGYSNGINDLDSSPDDPATTPPYLYDAYAVMRHLGSSGNGGHYISLVRDAARGCWRKFDDERATDFDPRSLKQEQRLQNEQAYLVFYARSGAR